MSFESFLKSKIEQLVERIKKTKKRSIYCILVGFFLAILSIVFNSDSTYVRENEIVRGSYGTQKTPYNIKVDVDNLAKNMEFSVSVSAREYTREEADEKFKSEIEKLKLNILNENENFECVNSKLNFIQDLGDGIHASYSFEPKRIDELYEKYETRKRKKAVKNISTISTASENSVDDFKYFVNYQKVIDGSGNVHNDSFKQSDFCTGYIVIQLSTNVKEEETSYKSEKYMLPVRVICKKLSPVEAFRVAFKSAIESNDRDTIDKDTIVLPKVVNDYRVSYKEKKDISFLLMPLLGFFTAILFEAKDKEDEKEKIKRRQRWLELDFSQIITKILLYVSSGMTIRNSIIRLAEQYKVSKNNIDKRKDRVAYDELVIVKNKLDSGYSEISAYEEMAKNINMRSYTRFLNIIIQSIKNGNKDLKSILNMEVQDALYERKQHAKKLGEEAATKLVLPLMMMLSIIMVVIMVPAFMGM